MAHYNLVQVVTTVASMQAEILKPEETLSFLTIFSFFTFIFAFFPPPE